MTHFRSPEGDLHASDTNDNGRNSLRSVFNTGVGLIKIFFTDTSMQNSLILQTNGPCVAAGQGCSCGQATYIIG